MILEAAAKTLSERDDTEVVFISALGGESQQILRLNIFFLILLLLDYEENSKKSDDILDIMLR